MKTLRDYQESATQALFDYLYTSSGNPLVIAPVAAGKSLMMAEFCKRAISQYPNTRILALAHVKELLQQNSEELAEQFPECRFTFYCAGLGEKDHTGQVVFGSIQSIYKKGLDMKPPNIVVVDEAHLIPPDESTMYQKLFADLLVANPKMRIVGFTGTPYRPDTGLLIDGDIFDDVADEIEMQYLIDNGFLCPPITPTVSTKMDTTGVGTTKGDYIQSQLAKAVDKSEITISCVSEMKQIGADRKKWLIFAADTGHAEHITDELNKQGISARCVHSKRSDAENDKNLIDHRNGDYTALVNVAKLTTGYNDPEIDLLAFMRPTRSPVLYVQCVGRGMRVHPSKQDVMILDFGGVIDELGPIDKVNVIKKKGSGEGEAPVKQCPKCYELLYAGVHQCPSCGYEFEFELDIDQRSAKDVAVISSQQLPEKHNVYWMETTRHTKKGGRDSMKVTYGTATGVFHEWVCFEHTGFARKKAESWHIRCGCAREAIPDTIEQALAVKYVTPYAIYVRKTGKYPEIVGRDFREEDYDEEEIARRFNEK